MTCITDFDETTPPERGNVIAVAARIGGTEADALRLMGCPPAEPEPVADARVSLGSIADIGAYFWFNAQLWRVLSRPRPDRIECFSICDKLGPSPEQFYPRWSGSVDLPGSILVYPVSYGDGASVESKPKAYRRFDYFPFARAAAAQMECEL